MTKEKVGLVFLSLVCGLMIGGSHYFSVGLIPRYELLSVLIVTLCISITFVVFRNYNEIDTLKRKLRESQSSGDERNV